MKSIVSSRQRAGAPRGERMRRVAGGYQNPLRTATRCRKSGREGAERAQCREGSPPFGEARGFQVSQGRSLPGAAPQFGNRPYSKDIRVEGGGAFPAPFPLTGRGRFPTPTATPRAA